jgi:hypothetical protein
VLASVTMPGTLRISNLRAPLSAAIVVILLTVILAGCGESATPIPEPTPTPAPSVKADVHLDDPATASDVFEGLQVAGLAIAPNNASGGSDREPREEINATYAGWPLTISSFSTVDALRELSGFRADAAPGLGAPPYRIVGLNVLVSFGPATEDRTPVAPESRYALAAQALADALDTLIGPLEQSSTEPLRLPTAVADESAAAAQSPLP